MPRLTDGGLDALASCLFEGLRVRQGGVECGSLFRWPVRALASVDWVPPSQPTRTLPSFLSYMRTHAVASFSTLPAAHVTLSAVVMFPPCFLGMNSLALGLKTKRITTTSRGP